MIPSREAIAAIGDHRGDSLVVTATAALREWGSVSQRRELDVDLSDCMDKAPSVGLGIAIAHPQRRVMVLDCDSVLRANLSSLTTVANAGPKNLVHFLFEDLDHIATDGEAIPGLDKINFRALAEGSGYPRTFQFDDLEDFVIGLGEVLEGAGPTFVSLKVIHTSDLPGYPRRTMAESFKAVKGALNRER